MAMTSNHSKTLAWKLFKAIKTTQQQKPGLKPGFLINGAKETRTPDPLHAIEEFNGIKPIGSTGLTLN